MTQLPDYEKHCVLRYNVNKTAVGCSPPFSLLNFFYGRKIKLPNNQTRYLPANPGNVFILQKKKSSIEYANVEYAIAIIIDDGFADELIDPPETILANLYENGQESLVNSLVSKEFGRYWYKSRVIEVSLFCFYLILFYFEIKITFVLNPKSLKHIVC